MDWARREGVVWRNRALMLFDRVAVPVAVCDVYGSVQAANPAMAAECGTTPGQLRGQDVLDLFQPQESGQVERIAQALRLRHRSRYQVSVRWRAPNGVERYGELTADPVSDTVEETPALLVMLRVQGEGDPAPAHPARTPPRRSPRSRAASWRSSRAAPPLPTRPARPASRRTA